MATPLENARAIIDALMDYRGVNLPVEKQLQIVDEFIGIDPNDALITNDERAEMFLDQLLTEIRERGQHWVVYFKNRELKAQIDAARDAAASNF